MIGQLIIVLVIVASLSSCATLIRYHLDSRKRVRAYRETRSYLSQLTDSERPPAHKALEHSHTPPAVQ